MPSIVNLKFKGNKSFVAFSNLGDTESLTKTWKVCTKVASYLEQGQRLENLSWRLWHLQNLMVDTDNAKSKREFKKLSKNMGDKLDKEKGRAIESLEAPDFKRNASTDLIRQRAVERERSREASQNARPGTIKRMQFTFSVDAPPGSFPATSSSSYTFSGEGPIGTAPTKPDLRPSAEFREGRRRRRGDAPSGTQGSSDPASTSASNPNDNSMNDPSYERFVASYEKLHFPPIFSTSFGPTALLYSTPTLTNPMSYGEGVSGGCATGFSIFRPTIELPLDELLEDGEDDQMLEAPLTYPEDTKEDGNDEGDIVMRYDEYNNVPSQPDATLVSSSNNPFLNNSSKSPSRPLTHTLMHNPTRALAPRTAPRARPLTALYLPCRLLLRRRLVKLDGVPLRASRHSATAIVKPAATATVAASATSTSLNPSLLTLAGTAPGGKPTLTAPGGVKAECSNCGATHTPLWRRGLNDELNCNACGLYCKLHKRPRPKSMRGSHGEGRRGGASGEVVEIIGSAQCYNCHTTATPLWRKDDEGKTVCNACGLYYKLHGSARPISMKSDIIRKRSRHDARAQRSSLTEPPSANTPGTPSESPSQTQTPSASPGVSRRPTPSPSPILAPDSTTQPVASHSMSTGMGASAGMVGTGMGGSNTYAVYNPFPGPYHPDYLSQNWVQPSMAGVTGGTNEALPFTGADSVDGEAASNASSNTSPKTGAKNASATTNANANTTTAGRTAKRRRMSTDSVSEPPSSAVSYSSYGGDSFTTGSGATSAGASSSSRRSSMDFPFFSPYTVFRGNGNNAFWHHSSGGGAERSPQFVHPPMLPEAAGASDGHGHGHGRGAHGHGHSGMDFLHPPMMLPQEEESLFATYLHPPMILPQEGEQVQHGYEYGQGEYYETGGMQQY
ncbi:hypothetical protein DFH29DRAFT_984242 [Suillus ampliporus]|nr:hypothetical protein DFH29DRAFT_984242 [Suillus ampliporus]